MEDRAQRYANRETAVKRLFTLIPAVFFQVFMAIVPLVLEKITARWSLKFQTAFLIIISIFAIFIYVVASFLMFGLSKLHNQKYENLVSALSTMQIFGIVREPRLYLKPRRTLSNCAQIGRNNANVSRKAYFVRNDDINC